MTLHDEVMKKLEKVMKSTFENESLSITKNTKASDISNWDSLNHIQLMVELQSEFGITFSAMEMQNFSNVGDIYSCIQQKI